MPLVATAASAGFLEDMSRFGLPRWLITKPTTSSTRFGYLQQVECKVPSTACDTLGIHINRINRLACSHKEAISLAPAKTQIGAALG